MNTKGTSLLISLVCSAVYVPVLAVFQCGQGVVELPDGKVVQDANVFLRRGEGASAFPWSVFIDKEEGAQGHVVCLGTFLPSHQPNQSDTFITTGACFPNNNPKVQGYVVRFLQGDQPTIYRDVSKIIFIPYLPAYNDDSSFVIIKSRSPVVYSKNALPVCLPVSGGDEMDLLDKRCFVTEMKAENFNFVDPLQITQMRVYSERECNLAFDKPVNVLFEYCGSTLERGPRQWLGSSLVCLDQSRWTIRGIVSTKPNTVDAGRGYVNAILSNVHTIMFYLKETLLIPEIVETPEAFVAQSLAEENLLDVAEGGEVDEKSTESVEFDKLAMDTKEKPLSSLFKPDKRYSHKQEVTPSPWNVLIIDRWSDVATPVCSGSLLEEIGNKNYSDLIVTSANCVHKKSSSHNLVILTDTFNENQLTIDELKQLTTTRRIKRSLMLPLLVDSDFGKGAIGVALICLRKPYMFNKNVLPITVIKEKALPMAKCYVSAITSSGKIRQVHVRMLSKSGCKNTLGENFRGNTYFCALNRAYIFSVLQGSPLVCSDKDEWYQVGLYLFEVPDVSIEHLMSYGEMNKFQIAYYLQLSPFKSFLKNARNVFRR